MSLMVKNKRFVLLNNPALKIFDHYFFDSYIRGMIWCVIHENNARFRKKY